MKWILVYLTVALGEPSIDAYAEYDSMNECFDEREFLVESIGRPIVNYQAVCIQQIDEPVEKLNPNVPPGVQM